MSISPTLEHPPHPDPHGGIYSRTIFGFWLFLLSDFMLFGVLFATYAVLKNRVFGGPSAHMLFNLEAAFIQTMILLIASFTIGLAAVSAHRKQTKTTIALFSLTFLFGLVFMGMEYNEFSRLISQGNSWEESAFLSAFFTLVGTHGLHMIFALLWIIVFILPVCCFGLNAISIRRLTCLKMFWQFLNIVWIFIFSFVYLMGVA